MRRLALVVGVGVLTACGGQPPAPSSPARSAAVAKLAENFDLRNRPGDTFALAACYVDRMTDTQVAVYNAATSLSGQDDALAAIADSEGAATCAQGAMAG